MSEMRCLIIKKISFHLIVPIVTLNRCVLVLSQFDSIISNFLNSFLSVFFLVQFDVMKPQHIVLLYYI